MWLIPSKLHSVCSAEPEGLTSGGNSQPEVELWVTASGTPTLRPSSWRGWKTRPWSQRLFGAATSASYRLNHFAAWTPSSAASPVRTSAQPARARVSTVSGAGYGGEGSFEQYASYALDMSSLKTCKPSAAGGSLSLFKTWPFWGMTRSGVVSALEPLVLPTVVNECSSWPTPRASANENRTTKNAPSHGKTHGKTLAGEAAQWATPMSSTNRKSRKAMLPSVNNGRRTGGGNSSPPGLEQQVELHSGHWPKEMDPEKMTPEQCRQVKMLWSTPQAHDAQWVTPSSLSGGATSRGGTRKGELLLGGQAANWPTPTSSDQNSSGSAGYAKTKTHNLGTTLTDATARNLKWATPNAADSESAGGPQQKSLTKDARPFSRPVQPPTTGNESPSMRPTSRPRLNPAFACWLMGLPWWWTHPAPINFGASEMESWRYKQQLLLDYYSPSPAIDEEDTTMKTAAPAPEMATWSEQVTATERLKKIDLDSVQGGRKQLEQLLDHSERNESWTLAEYEQALELANAYVRRGRPPELDNAKKVKLVISEPDREMLSWLGQGNKSRGLREAVRLANLWLAQPTS